MPSPPVPSPPVPSFSRVPGSRAALAALLLLLAGGSAVLLTCTPSGSDSAWSSATDPTIETPTDTAGDPNADPDTGPDTGSSTDTAGMVDTGDPAPEHDFDLSELDPYVQPEVWVTPFHLEGGDEATIHYQGELADLDQVTLEYGFNGWCDIDEEEDTGDPKAAPPSPDPKSGAGAPPPYSGDSVAMTASSDGGFTATVALPEQARSIHMIFTAEEDDEDYEDDNDGLEYHWGVEFPYIGPYLHWNDEASPGTGVVVSWETSVPCYGVVAWAEGADAAPEELEVGDTFDTIHHVSLTGLTPDTDYRYQVLDSSGRASEVFSFHTPPEDPDSWRFLVLGDAQEDGEDGIWRNSATVLEEQFSDALFAVVTGDMPDWADPGGWWVFFDQADTLLTYLPLMPTPGNHDTRASYLDSELENYARYFDLSTASGSEGFYTWTYANARFYSLNSEDEDGFEEGGDQYTWLEDQLAGLWSEGERSADHVIGYWHIPAYNAGSRHYYEQKDYRPLTALLEGNVDWVFNGHEHLGHYFSPIRYELEAAPSGSYGLGEEDGVGYLVVPSAGYGESTRVVDADYDEEAEQVLALLAWPEVPESEDEEIASELGFLTVDIEGTSRTITVWGLGTSDDPASEATERVVIESGE